MKEFDLEKALAGEPVKLRDGSKAFIIGRIPTGFKNATGGENAGPLRGFLVKEGNVIVHPLRSWGLEGNCISEGTSGYDIVGMWEELIKVEDLPKPFKPKQDETYFCICAHNIHRIDDFSIHSSFDRTNAENGQCFRTEADAQKWVDFMKSMME